MFIETPSDLHMQSSTWSAYKHHNTVKILVACTPNGAISYISPVCVGSISDVELTRISGFSSTLEDYRIAKNFCGPKFLRIAERSPFADNIFANCNQNWILPLILNTS